MLRVLLTCLAVMGALPANAETRVPVSKSEMTLSFAPLVRDAAPAVVNIYAKIVRPGQRNPFAGDPFFEDFFRGFSTPQPRVQNSLGSGVILSDDGLVVSNFHVVGMATEIRVVLTDRREFNATVLLADEASDLAILKLDDAGDLPYLGLRNSDQVEVGELVLAIGNPFGVGQTVTSGIVSGLARSGLATGNARGYFLQTDAAINPGNSGGALIDVNGDLIGINTAILSRSGGSNGIGFAIPANLVGQFVRQARDGNSTFERPWAGMVGQPVDADLAAGLGLNRPDGILISDLHPQSPFAEAGFEVGDVIAAVDGEAVNSPAEMLFRMSITGPGGVATVTRMRGSEVSEHDVPMILAPDDPPAETRSLSEQTVLPGLELSRVNPAVIARFGLPFSLSGVVVTSPGQNGTRAGLQVGDVLIAINGKEIDRPADVERVLRDPGRRVSMNIWRRGQRVSLRFRL